MAKTRFGLTWFSGFRGEDLNAIFYQNMPNLHNRYISTERNISQKNLEYTLNTKMAARLKIEKRGDEILIVHCCFSVSQNELKF
jgi:RNase P subunit RPR2